MKKIEKQNDGIFIYDGIDDSFLLSVNCIDNLLNFEIFQNKVRIGEVGVLIKDIPELESIIKVFKQTQNKLKEPKSKAGRKKIYEGDSETLSIHVPSDKKEFIKSVVDAILEPMKIKN